jgi:hypothetical protein
MGAAEEGAGGAELVDRAEPFSRFRRLGLGDRLGRRDALRLGAGLDDRAQWYR